MKKCHFTITHSPIS